MQLKTDFAWSIYPQNHCTFDYEKKLYFGLVEPIFKSRFYHNISIFPIIYHIITSYDRADHEFYIIINFFFFRKLSHNIAKTYRRFSIIFKLEKKSEIIFLILTIRKLLYKKKRENNEGSDFQRFRLYDF